MPPRKRPLRAVPDRPQRMAPDLRIAVRDAIGEMKWLTDSDVAMKALAMRQAEEIELAVERADEYAAIMGEIGGDQSLYKRMQKLEAMCDLTKTVGWLGPQLQGVLRDLGGAPKSRAEMKVDRPVGSRLAQLRASTANGEHDS